MKAGGRAGGSRRCGLVNAAAQETPTSKRAGQGKAPLGDDDLLGPAPEDDQGSGHESVELYDKGAAVPSSPSREARREDRDHPGLPAQADVR